MTDFEDILIGNIKGPDGSRFFAVTSATSSPPSGARVNDYILNTASISLTCGGASLIAGGVGRITSITPFTCQATGNIRGATGATGGQGNTGATGATGATGPQGPQGNQGIQGLKGDKGDTGSGTPGIDGNKILTDNDLTPIPTTMTNFVNSGGLVGDLYINTSTGLLYKKTAMNLWEYRSNLKIQQSELDSLGSSITNKPNIITGNLSVTANNSAFVTTQVSFNQTLPKAPRVFAQLSTLSDFPPAVWGINNSNFQLGVKGRLATNEPYAVIWMAIY